MFSTRGGEDRAFEIAVIEEYVIQICVQKLHAEQTRRTDFHAQKMSLIEMRGGEIAAF